MRDSGMKKIRLCQCVGAALMVCGAAPVASRAQTTRSHASVSTTDAYGNVRPLYTPRRDVGNFANDVQRSLLRGDQLGGRRAFNRGGESPFAMPADRALYDFRRTSVPGLRATSLDAKRAYSLYGILGPRPRRTGASDINMLLSRQTDLLRATSFTAPVWRSLSSGGLPSAFPSDEVTDLPTVAAAPDRLISIEESMSDSLQDSIVRLRVEAWSHFEAGRFRRALRSFESLGMLDPDDGGARVAEVMCYLSIGSYRAAAVSLDHLAFQRSDLFAHPYDYSQRYGDEAQLRRVRVQCRLFAQANHRVARMAALNPFLLWFLGERKAASSEAAVVAQDHPTSPYAAWPRLMAEIVSGAAGDQKQS